MALAKLASGTGMVLIMAYSRLVSCSSPVRRGQCSSNAGAAALDAAIPVAAA